MLLTLLMLLVQPDFGLTRDPINIYWNTSNPLFSESSVPSIDVNSDISSAARQFDQINLICPSGRGTTETHIIYSVTRGKHLFIKYYFLCHPSKDSMIRNTV